MRFLSCSFRVFTLSPLEYLYFFANRRVLLVGEFCVVILLFLLSMVSKFPRPSVDGFAPAISIGAINFSRGPI